MRDILLDITLLGLGASVWVMVVGMVWYGYHEAKEAGYFDGKA